MLQAEREKRASRQKEIPKTQIKAGGFALIHRSKFPSHPVAKWESQWLGPYLVEGIFHRVATLLVNGRSVRVDTSKLKHYPSTLLSPPSPTDPQTSTNSNTQDPINPSAEVATSSSTRSEVLQQADNATRRQALQDPPATMTDEEMAAEGIFQVESISGHRFKKGRWQFKTR